MATKYDKWTKESLIKRVADLEREVKTLQGSSARSPSPGAKEKKKKKQKNEDRPLDQSRYSTRYIALKLAYLGREYNGFEYQKSAVLTTIEEELWKALVKSRLICTDTPQAVDFSGHEYSKCGRTDRGVSAFGQVIGIRVRSNRPLARDKNVAEVEAAAVDAIHDGDASARQVADSAGEGTVEENDGEFQMREQEKDGEKIKVEGNGEEEAEENPFSLEDEIPYCRVLNRLLPQDVRAIAWCPDPPAGFSARFSCRERQYRYFFTQPVFVPIPSSIEAPTAAAGRHKDGWLDIEAMRQAAKMFEGLHDFRNFCKLDPAKQITNFRRRMFEVGVEEVAGVDSALPFLAGPDFGPMPGTTAGDDAGPAQYPKVYSVNIRGSAFLWHQVRHMVAVLFLVGQGLEKPSIVAELLDVGKHPRKPNYTLASEIPLVLWDCIFPAAAADSWVIRRPRSADESGVHARYEDDALDWIYVGEDVPLNLHSSLGLADRLWVQWRRRRMDELLANRLLDFITRRADTSRRLFGARATASALARRTAESQRVFEGGDAPRYVGRYAPVLSKQLLPSPAEANDGWARSKGFASSEEMLATENWRTAVREVKKRGREAMEE